MKKTGNQGQRAKTASPDEPFSLRVGSRVYAKRATGVCEAGERGLAVEIYTLDGRGGAMIFFEQGRYDGFSEEECALMLHDALSADEDWASYLFQNVHELSELMKKKGKAVFDDERFPPFAVFEETVLRAAVQNPRSSDPKLRI